MTYEQHTITGELEITDSKTMKVIARKLTLTASRVSRLCGRRYYIGTKIEVTFPAAVNLDEGRGHSPWSGYSAAWLKNNATEIREMGSAAVIHTRKDTSRPAGVHPPYCCCPRCKSKKEPDHTPKVDIHLFVSPALKTRLAAVTKERGLDLCDIAREALEEWLKNH